MSACGWARRNHPRKHEAGCPPLASSAWLSVQQGLAWVSPGDLLDASLPCRSLFLQPVRQTLLYPGTVLPQQPVHVQHMGRLLFGFHGGCSHQSSPSGGR